MRLHRLRLTAFGPFAGEQDVDFDELSAAGLFLLHGPTGGGKTSVLDAVCYALYGQVPGARPATRLRSDHAQAGTPTEVVLELTLAGRRLEITRRPEQPRAKLRGSGVTMEKAVTLLREQRNGEWQARSRSHQEVGEEIRQLVGMSCEQFCQVVLLPQGEFATFLRASATERAALLGRLFDTRRFKSVEHRLRDGKHAAAQRLVDGDRQIASLAARMRQAAGDADADAYAAGEFLAEAAVLRCTAREQHDIARGALHQAELSHAAAEAAATQARELYALQQRHAQAVRRAASLAEHHEPRTAARTTLSRAQRATTIDPALTHRDKLTAHHAESLAVEQAALAALATTTLPRQPGEGAPDGARQAPAGGDGSSAGGPRGRSVPGVVADGADTGQGVVAGGRGRDPLDGADTAAVPSRAGGSDGQPVADTGPSAVAGGPGQGISAGVGTAAVPSQGGGGRAATGGAGPGGQAAADADAAAGGPERSPLDGVQADDGRAGRAGQAPAGGDSSSAGGPRGRSVPGVVADGADTGQGAAAGGRGRDPLDGLDTAAVPSQAGGPDGQPVADTGPSAVADGVGQGIRGGVDTAAVPSQGGGGGAGHAGRAGAGVALGSGGRAGAGGGRVAELLGWAGELREVVGGWLPGEVEARVGEVGARRERLEREERDDEEAVRDAGGWLAEWPALRAGLQARLDGALEAAARAGDLAGSWRRPGSGATPRSNGTR
nr:SMC family ATPase [Actinacidiphila bryophytorum]